MEGRGKQQHTCTQVLYLLIYHTHTQPQTHMSSHTQMHTHIQMHTRIHTRTHLHTQTAHAHTNIMYIKANVDRRGTELTLCRLVNDIEIWESSYDIVKFPQVTISC